LLLTKVLDSTSHSDSNSDEDTGHLRVTQNNNYWYNINSRGPSFRFVLGHSIARVGRVEGLLAVNEGVGLNKKLGALAGVSLIGHSDSNSDEDTGHLRVTQNNNYWYNINSRGPRSRQRG
jgi:pectate lyase